MDSYRNSRTAVHCASGEIFPCLCSAYLGCLISMEAQCPLVFPVASSSVRSDFYPH